MSHRHRRMIRRWNGCLAYWSANGLRFHAPFGHFFRFFAPRRPHPRRH